jgi:hypothetical protein
MLWLVLVPTSLSNLQVRVRFDNHDTVVVAGDARLVMHGWVNWSLVLKAKFSRSIDDLMW